MKSTLALLTIIFIPLTSALGINFVPFGGTMHGDSPDTYLFPNNAEYWGGFANDDTSLYPFSFLNGGTITFTASSAEAVDLYFRFEKQPFPDTEPSFSTELVTVNGAAAEYSIDIPLQGTNVYSSLLLILETRDVLVHITNIEIDTFEITEIPLPDPDGEESTALPILFDGISWTEIDTDGEPWPFNGNLQHYSKDQAIVENNQLILRMDRIEDAEGTEYHSSRLEATSNENLKINDGEKLSIEIIAKLPKPLDSAGNFIEEIPLWPSFVILGGEFWQEDLNVSWPYCGEIDLLEYSDTRSLNAFSNAVHFETNGHQYLFNSFETTHNLSDDFHKWRVDIYRYYPGQDKNNEIQFFFDDQLIWTVYENEFNGELWYPVNDNYIVGTGEKVYGLFMDLKLGGFYTGYYGDLNSILNTDFNHAEMIIDQVNITSISLPEPDPIELEVFDLVFDGAFGGASYYPPSTYEIPSHAQSWAGFVNVNTSSYPLSFPYGGAIHFTVESESEADLVFKFEKRPYPDIEPSFFTEHVTVQDGNYVVDIPAQDPSKTFSVALMYIGSRDVPVSITNIQMHAYQNEIADTDGDGVNDIADVFPNDATETADSDGDGLGDNADAFPNDATETADSDGDGLGDNADLDDDNDGVEDNADAFPNDTTETADSDGDGLGDNADAFPNDATESADTDNDGVGDNADAFPNDATEDTDTDGDGVGDNADAFPNDATEDTDTDGDGVGDNSDEIPNDATETADSDNDGVGDNADLYPNYNDSVILNFIFEYNSNHNYHQLDMIKDLRPGSTLIEVSENQATVQLQMEESSDLQTWEDTGTPATMTIPTDAETKFLRFKMAE